MVEGPDSTLSVAFEPTDRRSVWHLGPDSTLSVAFERHPLFLFCSQPPAQPHPSSTRPRPERTPPRPTPGAAHPETSDDGTATRPASHAPGSPSLPLDPERNRTMTTDPADTLEQLRILADVLPTRAPELLRWLLREPLTLGQLIAKRQSVSTPHPPSDPEWWRVQCALQSVLYDLSAAPSAITYDTTAGRFTLADDWRAAVSLYDRVGRRAAGDRATP